MFRKLVEGLGANSEKWYFRANLHFPNHSNLSLAAILTMIDSFSDVLDARNEFFGRFYIDLGGIYFFQRPRRSVKSFVHELVYLIRYSGVLLNRPPLNVETADPVLEGSR